MRSYATFRAPLRLLAPAALLVLAACSPTPIYKVAPTTLTVPPQQVAEAPERYSNAEVLWGGRIITVNNYPDHSEIEVLAYPLDRSQRPLGAQPASGRFLAVMPGYVERFDYPEGHFMTLVGRLSGTRAGKVGDHDYLFPLVQVGQSHVWTPEELESRHPDVHFGIGIGVIKGWH